MLSNIYVTLHFRYVTYYSKKATITKMILIHRRIQRYDKVRKTLREGNKMLVNCRCFDSI